MEDLAKNLWVQYGALGAFVAFLLLLHWDNRKKIEQQRGEFAAIIKEKEATILALNQKYLDASIERVKLTTEALVTFAAALGKLTEEVREQNLLRKTGGP